MPEATAVSMPIVKFLMDDGHIQSVMGSLLHTLRTQLRLT